MIQHKWRAIAALALLVAVAVGMRPLPGDPGTQMAVAAQQFLGTLDDAQRSTATMSFDDPARLKWHFIPLAERKGLQVKNMKPEQRQAALQLLRAAVSQLGYDKATEIMRLEGILRELEKARTDGPIRDPERYYFTIFGKPADKGAWGLSVEGHHLSLNFVVRDGELTGHTPAFYGANPAIVRSEVANAPKPGTRTIAAEEQLAFELLATFTADQRKAVVIADKAPADIRAAGEPQTPKEPSAGIAVAKFTEAQKKQLWSLLEAYVANMPATIGKARMDEIRATGIDSAHFAWAGADKPGVGHYYRVEGPTFLVEFVNTQPDAAGNPANHIHSVWRDTRGDFGIKR